MTITSVPSTPSAPSAPPGPPPTAAVAQEQPPVDRLWIGPSLVAALSVIGGSTALSATVTGGSWVVPLIEVIGVIWLLGIGCRLLRSPAPITVLVQFAGLVIALTGLFATSGWLGFIPNGRVLHETGDLLSGAWQQILGTVPPAPATIELSFLICLTVGTTGLIVDFLVAEARSPALVALPLLCLYSVPASIATDLLPWWSFAAPAALYAVLLAITAHTGARSQGRTTVGLVATALVIAAVGTTVAVVGGDAVHGISTEGRLPRNATGTSEIGLSPFISLRGDLQRGTPANLLRVTGLANPDYLRTIALTTFDGDKSEWDPTGLSDDGAADGALPGVDPEGAKAAPVRVSSLQFSDVYLPIYAHTVSVSGLAGGWQWDQNLGAIHRDKRVNPNSYTMRTAFPELTSAELEQDTTTPTADTVALPSSIPDKVHQLAETVTAAASTDFDKADALRKYFTNPANGFKYSLHVPPGNTGNPLTDFLANKQGFCEQYASTMAVMLRTLNIPTRVAVGFTQGERQPDGSYLITTNDAHAWVEVKFDKYGWVRFDPTPLTGGEGNQQGFAESAGGTGGAATSSATTTSSQTVAQNKGLAPDTKTSRAQQSGAAATADSAAAAPTGLAAVSAGIWWALSVVVLLAILLILPTLVRRMRRRHRLTSAGTGGSGAATAAWAEIEDLILDHGLPMSATESTRATANRLARTSRLTENARSRLRGLVIAAEQEWYGAEPGTSSADGKDLVAAVSAVGESLDRSSPMSLADRLLPRSVRPSSRD
ncbi:MAG: transglutaminaseTgpA domain-containing protein [Nakamurella sp.]